MSDQQNNATASQILNIGIYGCTKAGKTRFLFQLLSHWERSRQLLTQSEACQRFLETVESEIDKYGGSMPTAATTEGIRVKVRREGKEPPLELVLRDLRGELVSDELDNIASLRRERSIPTQVRECDAFLFFFDPASSESPADIDKHHSRELKRATMFVEYVLKVRENRHLPIVFVLTHLDQWENDGDICVKAAQWVSDVRAKLVESYDTALRKQYPKSIVDRKTVATSVSSVGKHEGANGQLEKIVFQLSELVAESEKYRRERRKPARIALRASVAIVVLFSLLLWLLTGNERASEPRTDAQINADLDKLHVLIKPYQSNAQLFSDGDAKRIHSYLKWLTDSQLLDTDEELSEKTRQRMRTSLEAVSELIYKKAESEDFLPSAHLPVLSACLETLPNMAHVSQALAKAQRRYWQLQRSHVVEQLAHTITRRAKVGSSSGDTLEEVISQLRDMKKAVEESKVFGVQKRKDLVQEIRIAETFCEDRRKSRSYPVTLSVTKASYRSMDKVPLRWRAISLQSPGQSPRDYGLKPESTNAHELSFKTNQETYQAALGLGTPITITLSENVNNEWRKVKQFTITTELGPLAPLGLPLLKRDQLEITKHLNHEGMELELKLSDLPRVPDLIWEASVEEDKP